MTGNPYFIGMGHTGIGFGSNGNLFAQIGSIGPAWQNTMLQGLNTQNAFNEFQDKQMVNQFRLPAIESAYGWENLHNLYGAQQEALDYMALLRAMNGGNEATAIQAMRNRGYNPDMISYSGNSAAQIVRQSPQQAQPTRPAMTGNYARTAPTPSTTPTGYVDWQPTSYLNNLF